VASFAGKFESKRQDWTTPTDLFVPLREEFGFTLDAAASPDNALCENYLTAEDDALGVRWAPHVTWLNPPYGEGSAPLSRWVAKARDEAQAGATVVMLIPARTNTNWFHDICLAQGEVRFVRGRPKFGGAKHGLPQPLCLVIFRPPSVSK
jgi:phage N-6-adenine-methyltransferase